MTLAFCSLIYQCLFYIMHIIISKPTCARAWMGSFETIISFTPTSLASTLPHCLANRLQNGLISLGIDVDLSLIPALEQLHYSRASRASSARAAERIWSNWRAALNASLSNRAGNSIIESTLLHERWTSLPNPSTCFSRLRGKSTTNPPPPSRPSASWPAVERQFRGLSL